MKSKDELASEIIWSNNKGTRLF